MNASELDTQIPLPIDRIADLCRQFGVERLDVFGSILREDFRHDSDVDFLVVFRDNDYGPCLSKLQNFEDELERLIGRHIDMVGRRAVERSPNYLLRQHILSTATPIYVEG